MSTEARDRLADHLLLIKTAMPQMYAKVEADLDNRVIDLRPTPTDIRMMVHAGFVGPIERVKWGSERHQRLSLAEETELGLYDPPDSW